VLACDPPTLDVAGFECISGVWTSKDALVISLDSLLNGTAFQFLSSVNITNGATLDLGSGTFDFSDGVYLDDGTTLSLDTGSNVTFRGDVELTSNSSLVLNYGAGSEPIHIYGCLNAVGSKLLVKIDPKAIPPTDSSGFRTVTVLGDLESGSCSRLEFSCVFCSGGRSTVVISHSGFFIVKLALLESTIVSQSFTSRAMPWALCKSSLISTLTDHVESLLSLPSIALLLPRCSSFSPSTSFFSSSSPSPSRCNRIVVTRPLFIGMVL